MNKSDSHVALCIYATKKYTYALKAQARRVLSNVTHLKKLSLIICVDESEECKEAVAYYNDILKDAVADFKLYVITAPLNDSGNIPYKQDMQLLIAQMLTACVNKARVIKADETWLLEADILPHPNSLSVLQDSLRFNDGMYSVAFGTYPSQGGGSFLGGYGSRHCWINEDFNYSERLIPEEEKKLLKKLDKRLVASTDEAETNKIAEEIKTLIEKSKAYPPDGNIFQINGKNGWRRRGWFEHIFPALTHGSIIAVDWCGTGCTLLNAKALKHTFLDGYSLGGTQDLYLCYEKWLPENIRVCLNTAALSDHIVRARTSTGEQNWNKYVHIISFFETDGEYKGHIRQRPAPFFSMDFGEKYNPENDGKMDEPKESAV